MEVGASARVDTVMGVGAVRMAQGTAVEGKGVVDSVVKLGMESGAAGGERHG